MSHRLAGFPRRVMWTRGEGCAELALAIGPAVQVEGDLRSAVIKGRADLLVARKLTSFDLVGVAVPHGFSAPEVSGVVAAVGGGPHSALAAVIAGRLAASLGVTGSIASASASSEDDAIAEGLLAEVGTLVPEMPAKVVRAASARHLVDGLPEGSLLVVGAPGGSWMQRQFFGPGRQLVVRASAGAVVVRSAPARCFHAMEEASPFGPAMPVTEARRLLIDSSAPVVDAGVLVGIVRRSALVDAAGRTVGEVSEDPVFVSEADPLEAAAGLLGFVDPVPVVDSSGRLKGVVRG